MDRNALGFPDQRIRICLLSGCRQAFLGVLQDRADLFFGNPRAK